MRIIQNPQRSQSVHLVVHPSAWTTDLPTRRPTSSSRSRRQQTHILPATHVQCNLTPFKIDGTFRGGLLSPPDRVFCRVSSRRLKVVSLNVRTDGQAQTLQITNHNQASSVYHPRRYSPIHEDVRSEFHRPWFICHGTGRREWSVRPSLRSWAPLTFSSSVHRGCQIRPIPTKCRRVSIWTAFAKVGVAYPAVPPTLPFPRHDRLLVT